MSEELESCPVCGALPIDQVDSRAVRELVRDRYKFSRQELLDDCASREAARRIVDWADNGKLADDEWLVERNETAIIAISRALLSTPRVEEIRRKALEEAAKVADGYAGSAANLLTGEARYGAATASAGIANVIRSLSPQGE